MPQSILKGEARPGELSHRESALRTAFLEEVNRIPGGDRLQRCIQCGTCSGSCPVSYAMDVQPRQLVAFFRAGDLDSIMKSRTIWICASCYSCSVRCPSEIRVTDLIYGLKRIAIEGQDGRHGSWVPELARGFTEMIRGRGRNHELLLMLKFYLRVSPRSLFGLMPLGWRMWRAGRLQLRGEKIKGIKGLRKIIDKAEEMEAAMPGKRMESLGAIGYGVITERPAGGIRP